MLSSLLKKVLQQPRPAATCVLLGNCHKHGMPSSHSAVIAFAAVTALLLFNHRTAAAEAARKQPASPSPLTDRLARAVELLQLQALLALAAAVGYGRVYLGYHSPAQVAAGMALGAALAAAWWRLTLAACCGRWASALLRLAPLRALHMRSTLCCGDVHAREAALFAAASAKQRTA